MADEVQGLVDFDLGRLAELDGGRNAIAFQQAMRQIAMDIEDRPADSGARVLTIKIGFKPDTGQADGLLDGAKMQVTTGNHFPDLETKTDAERFTRVHFCRGPRRR